jgi:hypothetical protein
VQWRFRPPLHDAVDDAIRSDEVIVFVVMDALPIGGDKCIGTT